MKTWQKLAAGGGLLALAAVLLLGKKAPSPLPPGVTVVPQPVSSTVTSPLGAPEVLPPDILAVVNAPSSSPPSSAPPASDPLAGLPSAGSPPEAISQALGNQLIAQGLPAGYSISTVPGLGTFLNAPPFGYTAPSG